MEKNGIYIWKTEIAEQEEEEQKKEKKGNVERGSRVSVREAELSAGSKVCRL